MTSPVSGSDDPAQHLPGRDAGGQDKDDALHESMAAMMNITSAEFDLTQMLIKVAKLAVQAIPGADGAGLTLLEIDRADLIVMSEEFVHAIDDIQYGLGEGPCISAAQSGKTLRSGMLSDDPRWPQFGPRASELGVHSALSLPLLVSGETLGAMNVYAHAPDSFTDRSQRIGETFAVSAALVVQRAQVLEQTARLVIQLRAGLAGRGLIDRAVGVLRRRHGGTVEQCLKSLSELSDARGASLSATALSVIEDAVDLGRENRSEPNGSNCDGPSSG